MYARPCCYGNWHCPLTHSLPFAPSVPSFLWGKRAHSLHTDNRNISSDFYKHITILLQRRHVFTLQPEGALTELVLTTCVISEIVAFQDFSITCHPHNRAFIYSEIPLLSKTRPVGFVLLFYVMKHT